MTETSPTPPAFAPLRPLPARPLVSIVTPSYNQARFLAESIESVLAQTYQPIDYLVVDGGSTDGSLEILRSYGDRVRWISEKDDGQADAIAKGFERTRGEVLAWINSDDKLLPHAIERAVRAFREQSSAGLVYSNGVILDDEGRDLGPFPWIEPFDLWRLVNYSDFILQPSAFFRRDAYERIGGLDRGLHFAMDWDLWIRLAGVADVAYLEGDLLACSRVWNDTKTATGGWGRIGELARLAKRHTGSYVTPAVKRYGLDTLGARLRARLPRVLYRLAATIGASVDGRILREMPAHSDGWLGPRGELLFPRRWRAAILELEMPTLPFGAATCLTLSVDGRPGYVLRSAGRHSVRLTPAVAEGDPFCRVALRASGWLREPNRGRKLSAKVISLGPA